ncbi:MAG: hypothetical protein HY335_10485 [Deinococcus sp.]|nr:hypothetical protein [Deinococcus sp.]
MPKRFPPLTPLDVERILKARGFVLERSVGSHYQYQGMVRGVSRRVTVMASVGQYDDRLIKYMISQSGLTREEFYGATKATARKIGLRQVVELKD